MDPKSETGLPSLGELTIEEHGKHQDELPVSGSPAERPITPQSAAEPTLADYLQAHRAEAYLQRPRNRSPYSRTHLRSHSAASNLSAPPMARTRSLPTVNLGDISPSRSPVRSSSPLRSPAATRPPRRSLEEVYPHAAIPTFMDIESIAEDSELDLKPRASGPDRELQSSPILLPPHSVNFSRSGSGRRRPASPLYQLSQPPPSSPSMTFASTTASSSISSPSLGETDTSKFNEPYPSHSFTFSATSSMPSTPTSLRSRSPSISSLETIPDSPDAEEEATEAYNIARLKAAADAEDEHEHEHEHEQKTRSGSGGNLEIPRGAQFGKDGNKRKRWSVCGAERRGDFEMETIWED